MTQPPTITRTWSVGSIVSATASIIAVLSVVVALIWGYAGVTYATQSIPSIKAQQESNTRDIAVLKVQQINSDARYTEILNQLSTLNSKFDRLSEQKADKSSAKEWVR